MPTQEARFLMTRRGFLATAAGAFAFRNETLRALEPLCGEQGEPYDEAFWLRMRSHFDIDPELTVFNHAGLSPSTIAVREAMAVQTKRANQDPSYHIWRRQDSELDPIRERLAKLVGCAKEELALVPNCTYGLQTGILGAPMKAGDHILTTTHDYPRAFTAMNQRQRREGVEHLSVPLASPPESPAKIVQDIWSKVTDRTRLVLMCQMTFTTGQVLPVREVAQSLSGKEVPLFVDAAHGIGLLPDKFSAMGADIYAACLHKWLMGPIGTGVFVVKRPWISRIWPLHPADETLDGSITKFEQVGTRPAAPFLALKETLDFHEMIGRDRKAERIEALRRRLADKVLNESNAVQFGSLDPAVCRAVLTVGFKNVGAIALAAWLLDKHRIHVTTMVRAGLDALRISPNIFTTEGEIDRLGAILAGVAQKGIS